jgi:hypothetical protein
MRRIWTTALLAVPLLFLSTTNTSRANPDPYYSHGFGAYDFAFRLFPHIHQHGPLFNYGPYYGYYPFTPYGPWDPYLRYNPYFYGDPYADFGNKQIPHPEPDHSGRYGLNPIIHPIGLAGIPLPALPSLPSLNLFHKPGCTTCGFWHASWLHGGWFRGHTWVHEHPALFFKPACASCGGIAVTEPTQPTGDVFVRYSGLGSPAQSAVYYPATPTLDPAVELAAAAGQAQ